MSSCFLPTIRSAIFFHHVLLLCFSSLWTETSQAVSQNSFSPLHVIYLRFLFETTRKWLTHIRLQQPTNSGVDTLSMGQELSSSSHTEGNEVKHHVRTLRGKSWKSCLNWLVFLGSLEQSPRAKFNLMLLTMAFSPAQQDWDRKRKEERGVSSTVHSSTVLHLPH